MPDFDISVPETPTSGDYLSFEILDGGRERKGRITGTALAVLGPIGDRRETFLVHFARIGEVAFAVSRKYPDVDVVMLTAEDFR